MNSEETYSGKDSEPKKPAKSHLNRLKILGFVFTLLGIGLFCYFVFSIGLIGIHDGIFKIGFGGFAIILLIYLLRITVRSTAWRLSVYEPHKLGIRDTFPAVIIGEALSSILPLGILVSGTAKALAVRKKLPIVVGLSTVATENLFFSLVTGLFLSLGALGFLRVFDLPETTVYMINFLIASIVLIVITGFLIVYRQWHWASDICDWVYEKGFLPRVLKSGRKHIRLFENQIFGFYQKYPKRFLPIFLLQIAFHLLGIFEVWFILSRIGDEIAKISTSFFLESISRFITTVFKLIPFAVGIDEAGAEFVVETLGIGTGIGVTLAVIRKGRILFWAAVGMLLITKRGISLKEINEIRKQHLG